MTNVTNAAWMLQGNSGTKAWDGVTGDYVGHSDAQPLVIATTNTADPQPVQFWAGNEQVLRLNPPGTAAPAWSIQRDEGGNQRGYRVVDLQAWRNNPAQVASGDYSVIGGGSRNTASGEYSTVGGGWKNTASGQHSVVVGGRSNTANASYVMVFGEDVDPSVTETHRVYLFGDGSAGRPSGFLVVNRLDGDFPIHVGTNNTNGNGAYLSAGGTWTNASSRSKKDRFVKLDPQEVLEKIRRLPVEGWYYKGTSEYHIGPCAEDFHDAFGTGVLDSPDARTSLAASDVAGVALLGIKALAEQVEREGVAVRGIQEGLRGLRQEGAVLREKVTALEQKSLELEQKSQALEQGSREVRQRWQELERGNRLVGQRLVVLERLVRLLVVYAAVAQKLGLGKLGA